MTTAVLKIQNKQGTCFTARALLDSCSTVNLITQKFANSLNLTKHTCSINIDAVNGMCTVSNDYIKATFQSMYTNFKRELNFLIVLKIAALIPSETFPRDSYDIPKNIQLADPQFHVPKSVDVLLAAGTTLSMLSIGQIKLRHQNSKIVLQKTVLGWIIAGGSDFLKSPKQGTCNLVKLDKLVQRFWMIEDFDHEPIKSRDEIACEQHYIDHTSRDETGRLKNTFL